MTQIKTRVPILGLAAYSGTGKTSLLVKLLPILADRGLRVGVIKNAHHTFEIDQPGKDSYQIRKAGAQQMLIGSEQRWALMVEQEEDNPLDRLQTYVQQLDQNKLDVILVEGFKPEAINKIELYRPSLGHPLICEGDDSIIAIATDVDIPHKPDMTILNLNNANEIAGFIEKYVNGKHL